MANVLKNQKYLTVRVDFADQSFEQTIIVSAGLDAKKKKAAVQKYAEDYAAAWV